MSAPHNSPSGTGRSHGGVTVPEHNTEGHQLQRHVGAVGLLFASVGFIIGSG